MATTQLKKAGQRLREMREGVELSREEVCELLHIAESTLRNIENGQQKGGHRTLMRLKDLYANPELFRGYSLPDDSATQELRDAPPMRHVSSQQIVDRAGCDDVLMALAERVMSPGFEGDVGKLLEVLPTDSKVNACYTLLESEIREIYRRWKISQK